MKFGLMYEIQVPEPHHPGIEQERYKQVLAQVDLADEEGFDYFWTVEHHFLREFSHCSAPEVLYGAISQRTKRIRIGHAVALLPGQYNHPVRVAERAAVLDILSDGRMDLGTGRSTTLIEMDGFEVNPEETRAQWEEAVRMIPRMWTEETFSHEGQFYTIPPRSVIPKPVQKPHPPMWVACSQPDSFRSAGEMGLGVLCFNLGGYAQMEERVGAYREALKNANPVGQFVNDQVAALCMIHVAEDDEEARRVAAPEGGMVRQQGRGTLPALAGTAGAQLLPVRRVSGAGGTGQQDRRRPYRVRGLCHGRSRHGHQSAEELRGSRRRPDSVLHADGQPGPLPHHGLNQAVRPPCDSLFQVRRAR